MALADWSLKILKYCLSSLVKAGHFCETGLGSFGFLKNVKCEIKKISIHYEKHITIHFEKRSVWKFLFVIKVYSRNAISSLIF